MRVTRSEEATVLHISGALSASTAGELLRRVETLVERGERSIVVSLADVTDADAAGIGALIGAHNLAEAAGGRLRIADAAGWTSVLLARTGVLGILEAGG